MFGGKIFQVHHLHNQISLKSFTKTLISSILETIYEKKSSRISCAINYLRNMISLYYKTFSHKLILFFLQIYFIQCMKKLSKNN